MGAVGGLITGIFALVVIEKKRLEHEAWKAEIRKTNIADYNIFFLIWLYDKQIV